MPLLSVARLGDITTAAPSHACDAAPVIEASPTTTEGKANIALASGVFVNSKPVAVVGSTLDKDHTFLTGGSCAPHPTPTAITTGSPKVFVGGNPIAYADSLAGSVTSCPGKVTSGSGNVKVFI